MAATTRTLLTNEICGPGSQQDLPKFIDWLYFEQPRRASTRRGISSITGSPFGRVYIVHACDLSVPYRALLKNVELVFQTPTSG